MRRLTIREIFLIRGCLETFYARPYRLLLKCARGRVAVAIRICPAGIEIVLGQGSLEVLAGIVENARRIHLGGSGARKAEQTCTRGIANVVYQVQLLVCSTLGMIGELSHSHTKIPVNVRLAAFHLFALGKTLETTLVLLSLDIAAKTCIQTGDVGGVCGRGCSVESVRLAVVQAQRGTRGARGELEGERKDAQRRQDQEKS